MPSYVVSYVDSVIILFCCNRQAKEKELKEKIKDHAETMKARRKKPKGNPQEEMDAALKELEIVCLSIYLV